MVAVGWRRGGVGTELTGHSIASRVTPMAGSFWDLEEIHVVSGVDLGLAPQKSATLNNSCTQQKEWDLGYN